MREWEKERESERVRECERSIGLFDVAFLEK